MSTPDSKAFYTKQISLTEWLQGMGHQNTAELRREDLKKYDRLETLRKLIGLPFHDPPKKFPATAVAAHDPKLGAYIKAHAGELCMLRVAPRNPSQPKLRMRGLTVTQAVEWFKQQAVDSAEYDLYFVPDVKDYSWATIFVVNSNGIFGEAINGAPNKLTQGLYEAGEQPLAFSFDFQNWQLTPPNTEAATYIRGLVSPLKVTNPKLQAKLKDRLGASFSHDYLCGYFETTDSYSLGTWYLDYSPTFGKMYKDFGQPQTKSNKSALLSGRVGSPGRATGRVRIIDGPHDATAIEPGEILVCRMTTPDYLPLMQRAAAIVTDLGGILSHAAIVARELGKPCLTATGRATEILATGQLVEVDADAGVVRAP